MEIEIVAHPDFKVEFSEKQVAYPLYSTSRVVVGPGCSAAVDVNIVNVRLPHGTFGWITGIEKKLFGSEFLIGGGVIDEDYRGVVKVIVINISVEPIVIGAGQLIAYMSIVKYGRATFKPTDNEDTDEEYDGDIKLPEKAHETDAGYDVFCPIPFNIAPFGRYVVDIPISIVTDTNNPYMIHSRSGLSLKKCLIANGIGDSERSITFELVNYSPHEVSFVEGDKVAQIVIHNIDHFRRAKTTLVEKIDTDTKRGTGGFGSTDTIPN